MEGTWKTTNGGGGSALLMLAAVFVAAAIAAPIVAAVISIVETILIVAAIVAGVALVAGIGVMFWRWRTVAAGSRLPVIAGRWAAIPPGHGRPGVNVPLRPEVARYLRPEVPGPDRALDGQTGRPEVHNHTHLHLSGLSPDAAEAIGRALHRRSHDDGS